MQCGRRRSRISLPHNLVLTKIFDIPAALCDVQFGNDNTCRVPPLDPVEHIGIVGFDPTDIGQTISFSLIVKTLFDISLRKILSVSISLQIKTLSITNFEAVPPGLVSRAGSGAFFQLCDAQSHCSPSTIHLFIVSSCHAGIVLTVSL